MLEDHEGNRRCGGGALDGGALRRLELGEAAPTRDLLDVDRHWVHAHEDQYPCLDPFVVVEWVLCPCQDPIAQIPVHLSMSTLHAFWCILHKLSGS